MDVTPTHPHTGQPKRGWRRWRGMFNLNDPRWGRDEGGQDGRNDEDARGGQRCELPDRIRQRHDVTRLDVVTQDARERAERARVRM